MAISLVFSADKMSIMDNKAQDQFQQGLVGLILFHSQRPSQPSYPLLTKKTREENSHKSAFTGGKPMQGASWAGAPSALESFHSAIIIYLDTFAGPDYSR